MNLKKIFTDAIIKNNPIFIQLIGLCSVLAITNSATNAISMGLAVTFVAVMSNLVVSAIRRFVIDEIRIPIFIVIIATFVTIVQMVLEAFFQPIYRALGIFIPLIVVNCCILGRAEGFAYKNKVVPSIFDGLGTGIGYTVAVLAMGIVRELFGAGSLFGVDILPEFLPRIGLLTMPAGSFILLGFLIAGFKKLIKKKA